MHACRHTHIHSINKKPIMISLAWKQNGTVQYKIKDGSIVFYSACYNEDGVKKDSHMANYYKSYEACLHSLRKDWEFTYNINGHTI